MPLARPAWSRSLLLWVRVTVDIDHQYNYCFIDSFEYVLMGECYRCDSMGMGLFVCWGRNSLLTLEVLIEEKECC